RISQFGDAVFINKCLAYRTIWPGAYNQQFSLKKRLDTNILIKEKLYQLIQEKNHTYLPRLEDIRNYLKLHWSIVALKKAKFFQAFSFFSTAFYSPKAWKLLLSSILNRKQQGLRIKEFLFRNQQLNKNIKKIVLIQ
ncbi:MAG: glycosyltransferase family 2 protein, partial [Planktothrix sp.]